MSTIEKAGLPRLDAESFLRSLAVSHPTNSIYYPGSGKHSGLEKVFPRETIYYLDDNPGEFESFSNPVNEKSRNCITADYTKSPFRDKVFDALFFEDNHATPEEFEEMLKTLKVGGVVIMGYTCFGLMDKISAMKTPGLKLVKLPFRHESPAYDRLIVLQKITAEIKINFRFSFEGFDVGESEPD